MEPTVIGPLTKHNPAHWAWVPRVCEAAAAFIPLHHSNQDPVAVVQFIHTHFVADTGQMGAWVWSLDDQTIDGHLLLHVEDHTDKRRVAFVDQLESRVPTTPTLQRAVIGSAVAWARRVRATDFEGWIIRPALLRLYRRFGLPVEPVMTAVRCSVAAAAGESPHGTVVQ